MTKRAAKPSLVWQEVGREIAIVFVGVLVALYAQQVVDNWQWRAKVRTAEAAMQRELFFDNGPQIYGRAVVHPCLQQRLGAVRTAVQSGKSREEIADLIAGVQVDFTSYDSLAVQSAFASDVAAHMPQDRLNAYIQSYQMIPQTQLFGEHLRSQASLDCASLSKRTLGPEIQQDIDPSGALLRTQVEDRVIRR